MCRSLQTVPNNISLYSCIVLKNCLPNKKLIVVGDFNAPVIERSTLSASTPSSVMLYDMIFRLNLTQLIMEPTQVKGNTLDLLITNIETMLAILLLTILLLTIALLLYLLTIPSSPSTLPQPISLSKL